MAPVPPTNPIVLPFSSYISYRFNPLKSSRKASLQPARRAAYCSHSPSDDACKKLSTSCVGTLHTSIPRFFASETSMLLNPVPASQIKRTEGGNDVTSTGTSFEIKTS